MWPHEESLADEPIVVRGASIEEAARTAQDLIGRPVKVVKADRIRRGGIAGFFATDLGVEVTVVPVSNVAYDRPSVSFAEAFERLMADAATGDQHDGTASRVADAERSVAVPGLVAPVLPVPGPLVVDPDGRPVLPTDIEEVVTDGPVVTAPPVGDVDVRREQDVVEPLEPAPQPVTAMPLPASALPGSVLPAPALPASALPAPALPASVLPAPALPAPVQLSADHGRMARDVAEAMISHLGEHGTVSVSVRISLADGSELRADARAGTRS